MCSGSDLDGDLYWISWHPRFLQHFNQSPPMDYSPPPPIIKEHVAMSDIKDFVRDFARSDVLGIIANTHLAIANQNAAQNSNMAADEKCIK